MNETQPFHTLCPSCDKVSFVLPEKTATSGSFVCPFCRQRFRAEEFWTEEPEDVNPEHNPKPARTARDLENGDHNDDTRLRDQSGAIIIPGVLKTKPEQQVPGHTEVPVAATGVDSTKENKTEPGSAAPPHQSSDSAQVKKQAPKKELKSPFKAPRKDDRDKSFLHIRTQAFPVELKVKTLAFGEKVLIYTLSLVLLAALALQYVWYNPQSMAGINLPSPFCTILPCPDAEITAADYRSLFLQVRENPDQANSLLVNFAFSNNNSREIPFPVARLSFFDERGRVLIASRDFQPDEYLPAQLRLLDLMPDGSQAQVELEIVDPGAGAAKYTLELLPP